MQSIYFQYFLFISDVTVMSLGHLLLSKSL